MGPSKDNNFSINYGSLDSSGGSCKTISVSSGKGGVGKTLSVINIALSLKKTGLKVLILDGDMGMSNVDIVLGLEARYNIRDVLDGHKQIQDILIEGPLGIKIIPSGSGITNLLNLSFVEKQIFNENLEELKSLFDVIITDTGAGIGATVLQLNEASESRVVVTTPEPHAIADAYALIKVLSGELNIHQFGLIVNMTNRDEEGESVARKIAHVSKKYLGVNVDMLGSVPKDPTVSKNITHRKAASHQRETSLSYCAWQGVARNILRSFMTERNYINWNSIIRQTEETL